MNLKTWHRDLSYLGGPAAATPSAPHLTASSGTGAKVSTENPEPREPRSRGARLAFRKDISFLVAKPTEEGPVGTAYLKHSIIRVAGAPGLGEETWVLVPALLTSHCGSLGQACDLT